LNLIAIDQIERIEVVKGAVSTVYGSNAMSGVINIITREQAPVSNVKLGFEGGDKNYYNTQLAANYKNMNLSFAHQAIGRIEKVSYNYSKHYQYNHDPAHKYNLAFNYRFLKNWHFNYFGVRNTLSYEKVYEDADQEKKGTDQIQNKNFITLRYEIENLRVKLYGNYDALHSEIYTDPNSEDTHNKNFSYGTDVDYMFRLRGIAFQSGVTTSYRAADYNLKYGYKYDLHSALFLQMKKAFLEKTNITIGIREQFVNGGSQNKNYHLFLPGLGIVYNFNKSLNSFFSFGKAFRTPTFNNLYYKSDMVSGNSQLKPETGYTCETGIKFDNQQLSYRFSAFYMNYKDKIELDKSIDPWRYVNAGKPV
jgi:iron complex outermembrane receptor protein